MRSRLPALAALAALCLSPGCERAAEPERTADSRNEPAPPLVAQTGVGEPTEIVRAFFAAIEAGNDDEARRLLTDGARASGADADVAAAFDRDGGARAEIGTPSRIEGAAGSLYVAIPVRIHGQARDGAPFSRSGTVRLRRCNDVPGCTEEQRRWRIDGIALPPAP